ncbi:MAG: hypothetical protein HYX54_00375 [Chloroflexi bacterium]|nr:hypothetical protein [Chloroflexota bacterium]
MNFNVVLPLGSSVLSFVFFVFLIDQWRDRRRPYQLIWAIGMLWYALSAGTEFLGGALGWSEPLYRAWYLIGAIWVAGWLGLGTVFLLAKTRFGYAFAVSLALAGLFTVLSWARYDYPGSGGAPYVYGLVALVLAIGVVVMTARRDDRWVWLAFGAIVGGSVLSLGLVLATPLAAPGYAVDPATHIPVGTLFPGSIRLLTPFFNVTGAFALTFGALYSTYVFMPKRRVIRYERNGSRSPVRLVVALVAIVVNFVASIPGAIVALLSGRLNSRVPATILIAIGGFIPAITSGANRFGSTSGFFVGEFLGVLFLFVGFLVSVEVFREFRIPFTGRVLRSRGVEA